MFESTKQTTALLRPKVWALTLLLATLTPAVAFAEGEALSQEHGNLLWTLIAAILVMFMQPGFALVEMGFSRAKNAGNILMKNLLDFSAGVPVFFLVGFGIMFGQDVAGLFGSSGFALSGVDPTTAGGQWDLTFLFFQSVFAATAATIISGGIAERTKFSAYIIVSVAVTALIYPISGHWAWGSLWGGDELGAG